MRIRCLALMIRISDYANEKLYQTLSSHLGRDCKYINNQRVIFVTDFKFNTRAIDNWRGLKSKNVGITPQNNQSANNNAEVKYQPLNKYIVPIRKTRTLL